MKGDQWLTFLPANTTDVPRSMSGYADVAAALAGALTAEAVDPDEHGRTRTWRFTPRQAGPGERDN